MTALRLKVAAGIVVLAVGGAATAAVAADRSSVRADLTGYEEVPAVSTEGDGTFRAVISRNRQEITYVLRYGDLSASVQQAHIHFGQRDVNGGVSVFLCTNLGNGPAGTQPCPDRGTVRGTIRPADVVGPAAQGIAPGEFDELVRALRAGKTYANVHTAAFPAGEVRGQLPRTHRGH